MPVLDRTDTFPNGLKLPGKSRWKPAIFSREGRNTSEPKGHGEKWKDIDDFLALSQKSSANGLPEDEKRPQSGSDEDDAGRVLFNVPSREEQYRINHPQRGSPRSKGLSVTFCTDPPEVIGEGGDEASSPITAISKRPKFVSHGGSSPFRSTTKSDFGKVPKPILRSTASPASRDSTAMAVGERLDGHDMKYAADVKLVDNIQKDFQAADVKENEAGLGHLKNFGTNDVERDTIPVQQPRDARLSPSGPRKARDATDGLQLPFRTESGSRSMNDSPEATLTKPMVKRSTVDTNIQTPKILTGKGGSEDNTGGRVLVPGPKTLKNVVKFLGNDALTEFSNRVEHFYDLFRHDTSSDDTISDHSFKDWIQAAVWWFLRGRKELEQAVRTKSRAAERSNHQLEQDFTIQLRQAYLNLAKAWWITTEVAPHVEGSSDSYPPGSITAAVVAKRLTSSSMAEYTEMYSRLTSSMRGLAVSMKRNERLPPLSLEVTDLDFNIWIRDSRELEELVKNTVSHGAPYHGGSSSKHVHSPLGDSEEYFNYGSMFVDLHVKQDGDKALGEEQLHYVLTIIRKKDEYSVQAQISSQTASFSFSISGDNVSRPRWQDFEWHKRRHTLSLRVGEDQSIELSLHETDYKTLWGIQEHAVKVQKSTEKARKEHQLCIFTLPNFHHMSTPSNATLGGEPLKDCVIRLFAAWRESHEGTGVRQIHRGFRIHVVSPSATKVLNYLNLWLDQETPTLFSYMRGESDAPTILLRLKNAQQDSKSVLTFKTREERSLFHANLDGTLVTGGESCSDGIPLQSAIQSGSSPMSSDAALHTDFLSQLPWQRVRVIVQSLKDQNPCAGTSVPRNARIWAECQFGSLVDRINVGPGELALSLDINMTCELKLCWPEQGDTTVSFSHSQLDKGQVGGLQRCLRVHDERGTQIAWKSRTYKFPSVADLHRFQRWLTGFTARFDGIACNFSISRRRMVVPLHKRLESSLTRLQVLTQGKTTHFLAFFKDFPSGTCICFVLKATDRYESFVRSGQYCIRMVDAKFALPKPPEEEYHEFTSLDIPAYATEHDDITVTFDAEDDCAKFAASLPAEAVKVSRLISIRK